MRNKFEVTLGLHQREVSIAGVDSTFLHLHSEYSIKKTIEEIRPDVLIHAAGLTSVEACERYKTEAQNINRDLAGQIATICAKKEIRLVHISTDHLFAGDRPLYTESDIVKPLNFYAKTKADAEILVRNACPDALIIRTNFFCWGPVYRSSFSDYIINSLKEGRRISLFDDVYYTPILAETLTFVVHELLELGAGGVFNVVGDERISKYNFGRKIASKFGLNERLIVRASINDREDLVTRPTDMSLSNQKVCQLLRRGLGNVDTQLARLAEQKLFDTNLHY